MWFRCYLYFRCYFPMYFLQHRILSRRRNSWSLQRFGFFPKKYSVFFKKNPEILIQQSGFYLEDRTADFFAKVWIFSEKYSDFFSTSRNFNPKIFIGDFFSFFGIHTIFPVRLIFAACSVIDAKCSTCNAGSPPTCLTCDPGFYASGTSCTGKYSFFSEFRIFFWIAFYFRLKPRKKVFTIFGSNILNLNSEKFRVFFFFLASRVLLTPPPF